ncbi:MAG: hypothetical protein H7Z75_09680 [Ferruginibacter sp.]|nr:hypothetical protein [Cytophagales bacterium]
MKKYAVMLGVCLSLVQFSNPARAQTAGGGSFEKGTILISPGISFGAVGYGGYVGSGSGFLPLSASLEYSLDDKFAVGPYLGFYSRKYSGSFRYSSFSFGDKGTVHATSLLNEAFDSSIDAEKIDLFASAYLGARTLSYTYDNAAFNGNYDNDFGLRLGVTIGGRYFFNPNLGVFLEVGYGAIGYSTLGVSFKL